MNVCPNGRTRCLAGLKDSAAAGSEDKECNPFDDSPRGVGLIRAGHGLPRGAGLCVGTAVGVKASSKWQIQSVNKKGEVSCPEKPHAFVECTGKCRVFFFCGVSSSFIVTAHKLANHLKTKPND